MKKTNQVGFKITDADSENLGQQKNGEGSTQMVWQRLPRTMWSREYPIPLSHIECAVLPRQIATSAVIAFVSQLQSDHDINLSIGPHRVWVLEHIEYNWWIVRVDDLWLSVRWEGCRRVVSVQAIDNDIADLQVEMNPFEESEVMSRFIELHFCWLSSEWC